VTAPNEPTPFNPETHPMREEALAAWTGKYVRQSIISNPPPSAFKCFFQGYVAGREDPAAEVARLTHALSAATAREEAMRALLKEAVACIECTGKWDRNETGLMENDLLARIDTELARAKGGVS